MTQEARSGVKRSLTAEAERSYPKKILVQPKRHEITLLLPIDAVGLVIGKGGNTLKKLIESSGAQIRVQEYVDIPHGCQQRGIVISGSYEAIEGCERDIVELLKFRRPKHDNATERAGETTACRRTTRWAIPAEMSGLLIGKRGIGRESIQQDSGAYIKLAHDEELPPGSNEKLVYIEGSNEEIEKAKALIEAKVGGRSLDKREDDYVYINTRAIGFLLGKGGSELKEMCQESGARIQVAPASELETGSVEVKIRLVGDEEQVKVGRQLVQAKIKKWLDIHPAKDHSSDPDGQESSIKIALPAVAVSPLIGKAGAGVKEMNAKSGASLKFLSNEVSHDTAVERRPMLLTGTLRNIFKAQRMLLERMAALPLSQRAPDRRPPVTPALSMASNQHSGPGILDSISLAQPVFSSGTGLYGQQQGGLLGDVPAT